MKIAEDEGGRGAVSRSISACPTGRDESPGMSQGKLLP